MHDCLQPHIWVLFGQLDLFILQWEEVLCNGFDLTVFDPSDRRGTDTYVSLLLTGPVHTYSGPWGETTKWGPYGQIKIQNVLYFESNSVHSID